MKFIALISGGKDSIYNIMRCIEEGHELVCLVNLYPAEQGMEKDSYMYQSVGTNIIQAVADAMEMPLIRRQITGRAAITNLDYEGDANSKAEDEVEDLFRVLQEVLQIYPQVQAVSSGAIASTYQKLRVEDCCNRLGLISLAYLWMQDQEQLLRKMLESKMEIMIIKIAAFGLERKHLGLKVDQLFDHFMKIHKSHGFHPCGEGGEFESLTLDCPLYKRRIEIRDYEVIEHSNDKYAPVCYLLIQIQIEDLNEYADQGFEPQEFEKPELFSMKPFQMTDFPSSEQIAAFGINEHKIVVTTLSKRIFRWRFRDTGCMELPLKQVHDENIAKSLLKLGENVGKGLGTGLLSGVNLMLEGVNQVTKPFFNASLRIGKKDDLFESKYDRIFIETKGTHLLVCSDKGETFHCGYFEESVKQLAALNGKTIRFVIFHEEQKSLESMTNTLMITSENKFYIYSLTNNSEKGVVSENLSRSIFQVPIEKEICEVKRLIHFGQYRIIIATNQSIYLLQGPRDYDIFFGKFKEGKEGEESLKQSEIKFNKSFGSMIVVLSNSILWTNGFQLSHIKYTELSLSLFENAQQIKYAKKYDGDLEKAYTVQEQLYGIGMTAYHYYLLTFDTITILSIITQDVVKYFDLNIKMMGKLEGMVYDQSTLCFWIYFKNGVYRLNTENEDIEIWKLLVEKKNYEEAAISAKKYDSPFYGHIAGLYADTLFQQKKFMDASKYYLLSNRKFCEVFLQFSLSEAAESLQALEVYLQDSLQNPLQGSQRVALLSYVLELMVVRKCPSAQIMEFIKQYLDDLREEIVIQILQPHGLFDECNEFAELKNQHENVVSNNLHAENYQWAVKKLKGITDQKLLMQLVQKYSYILMREEPTNTLSIIKQLPKLEPGKIIAPLLNSSNKEMATEFMGYCIEKLHCSDKTFNNLYIFYLTQTQQFDQLIKYCNRQYKIYQDKGAPNFDMLFALRLFKQHKQIQAQVAVFAMLGKFEQAVKLALKNNQLGLAKDHALNCQDESLSRKLWVKIVIWMLSRGEENIPAVVQLTREVTDLHLEDLLPHFNERIKLNDFQNELTNTLTDQYEKANRLKLEMDAFKVTGESLKKEYSKLDNRNIFISQKQKCEECYRALFTEEYIAFGCLHCFHTQCLWSYIKQNSQTFEPKKVSKLHDLYIQLKLPTETTRKSDGAVFGFFAKEQPTETQKRAKQKTRQGIQKEFEELLSEECVLCGNQIINTILLPLDYDDIIEESWFV